MTLKLMKDLNNSSHLQQRNANQTGFTLLEVMLALAVFALAGMAIIKTVNTSLNGSDHLEKISIAQWIASNQLVEANLDQSWPPKKSDGQIDMAEREWFYRQIVKETEDKNMRAIVIEVREEEKDENPLASLMTYVSNPKAR